MATSPLVTQSKLLADTALLQRVTMAVLQTASVILNENPAQPNHDNRLALANAAIRDPNAYSRSMYSMVIVQSGINEFGADSSQIEDTSIMTAVANLWDTIAN